jgi:diguanylate cyclase (GGDEF)-like protein/PAS domain S-box-containing protein
MYARMRFACNFAHVRGYLKRFGFMGSTVLVAGAIAALALSGIISRNREADDTRASSQAIDQIGFQRTAAMAVRGLAMELAFSGGLDAAQRLREGRSLLVTTNARARQFVGEATAFTDTPVLADLAEISKSIDRLVLVIEEFCELHIEGAPPPDRTRINLFVGRIGSLSDEIVASASAINTAIATKYQPSEQMAQHAFQDRIAGLIIALMVGYVAIVIVPVWRRLHGEAARLKAMSEEVWKLSTVAHRTTNSVVLTDVQGRIEWTNDAFESITGYALSEVRGRTPGSVLQFEGTDKATVRNIGDAIRAKRPVQAELLNRSKDGRIYWIRMDIQPLHSERGEHIGFMAIESDITELKKISSEVLLRNADLEMMSTLASIGEWVVDLRNNEIYWSREVRRIHEVDDDYVPLFSEAVAFYPEQVRETLTKGLETCVATKEPWESELPFITATGKARWVRVFASPVEEDGTVTKLVGALQDVTDIVEAREELAISGRRLELAAEGASIGLWDWDVANDRFWTHPKWWEHLGFEAGHEMVSDASADQFIHADDLPQVLVNRANFLDHRASQLINEFRHIDAKGEWRWISSMGRTVAVDAQGRITRVAGVYVDIHERKMAAERALYAANHDAMTGLVNRAEFARQIEARIESLPGRTDAFAILAIDLDRFKHINDTFGHAAGDSVLMGVARRLRAVVRNDDIVARIGGDEFAIILDGGQNCRELCEAVSVRILNEIQRPFEFEGLALQIGVSIGVAIAPEHGTDHGTLVRAADAALYAVKENGKNSFRLFDSELAARAQERRDLEADLREAQARGELEVHFQPQVDLDTRQRSSCEALLRWRHPRRGFVPPDVFIPIAEDTGLIIQIGQWVIEEACRLAARWPEPLPVSVNLSASQLGKTDLLAIVTHALLRSGLPSHRLEIEVTETVFLKKDDTLLADLRQLHDLGVRLALDDFGTGYASLGYLQKLPFDTIKIDKSFIEDIGTNDQSAAIVRAIVNLAHALSLDTTAEGVETEEQATLLRAVGCSIGQGYLFSRPVPDAELFASPGEVSANVETLAPTSRRAGGQLRLVAR